MGCGGRGIYARADDGDERQGVESRSEGKEEYVQDQRTKSHLLNNLPKSLLNTYILLRARLYEMSAHLICEGPAFGGCYLEV